jgi:hypothetical protein
LSLQMRLQFVPIFDTPLTGAERRKVWHIAPQEQ